jgi:catechol 2,3-dioxygenase-like lactoylglutathione lyase family enzyme
MYRYHGNTSTGVDAIYRPEVPVSRLQLALNVSDIDEAVAFYSKLFATEPAKRKPGYANFAIADPPLKLVLFEAAEGGTINHLGVETETADEVLAAEARLAGTGLETTGVDDTVCCYASKVETWVTDPDGARWEWYVKTGDTDQLTNEVVGQHGATVCCAPDPVAEPVAVGRSVGTSGCC